MQDPVGFRSLPTFVGLLAAMVAAFVVLLLLARKIQARGSARKQYERLRIAAIGFWGEQDGPPEQLLKERLAELFRGDGSVSRAYLARANLGLENKPGVVLGLRRQRGSDTGIVEKVGAIFADVFNSREHLDILFLTDSQEAEVARVCRPFFQAADSAQQG